MSYISRFISFLIVLFGIGYGGYFGFLNMERVYVNAPYFGEFRVAGALAFLAAFILGAVFAALFFGYDFFKKTFEVRKSRKALSKVDQNPHRRVSRFLDENSNSITTREPTV